MSQPESEDLARLRAAVTGPVYARGDEGLAVEAAGFNAAFTHDPDVVVGAANEADVVAAVRYAAAHRLPVYVQATGHGMVRGYDRGVLIVTRRLDTLEIDPATRLARLGAGLSWEPVVAAAAEHGLAAVTGSTSDVGVIGFLLGGGIGPISRSVGFGTDRVRSFRVVLASGEVVEASEEQHPTLFWALRGGKGGLGIVTEALVELLPLTEVYGGALLFDAADAEAVLRVWAAWSPGAPDTVTSSVALMRMPELELVPPPLRGRTFLALRVVCVGDPADAEPLLASVRETAEPFLGGVGPLPVSQLDSVHNDPHGPLPAWDHAVFLDRVDDEFVTTLLGIAGPDRDVPLLMTEVRHIAGAGTKNVSPTGSAAGGRDACYALTLIGAPVPELFETVLPGVGDAFTSALAPWAAEETNVNFSARWRGVDDYNRCWRSELRERLAPVRNTYDPEGVFAYVPA